MPNSTTYINQVCKKDQMGMNPSPEIPKYQKKKKKERLSHNIKLLGMRAGTQLPVLYLCVVHYQPTLF